MNSLLIFVALSALSVPAVAAAAGGGLNLTPDLTLLAANVLVLGLLTYPTHRLLLKPLVRILAEREQRTTGTMARAEAVCAEAAQVQEELGTRLARAREDAQARRNAIMNEVEAEERGILDAARAESVQTLGAVRSAVAEEISDARTALQAEAQALSREAAARILGRAL